MSDFPEFQHKPKKKFNYHERVKAGLQRGGLRKVSDKQKERNKLEQQQHNKNIKEGDVYCANCGSQNHLEKHHYSGRAYPDQFVYLCGEFGCGFHKWIHTYEDEAYELGWLTPLYRGLPDNPNHPKPWL